MCSEVVFSSKKWVILMILGMKILHLLIPFHAVMLFDERIFSAITAGILHIFFVRPLPVKTTGYRWNRLAVSLFSLAIPLVEPEWHSYIGWKDGTFNPGCLKKWKDGIPGEVNDTPTPKCPFGIKILHLLIPFHAHMLFEAVTWWEDCFCSHSLYITHFFSCGPYPLKLQVTDGAA